MRFQRFIRLFLALVYVLGSSVAMAGTLIDFPKAQSMTPIELNAWVMQLNEQVNETNHLIHIMDPMQDRALLRLRRTIEIGNREFSGNKIWQDEILRQFNSTSLKFINLPKPYNRKIAVEFAKALSQLLFLSEDFTNLFLSKIGIASSMVPDDFGMNEEEKKIRDEIRMTKQYRPKLTQLSSSHLYILSDELWNLLGSAESRFRHIVVGIYEQRFQELVKWPILIESLPLESKRFERVKEINGPETAQSIARGLVLKSIYSLDSNLSLNGTLYSWLTFLFNQAALDQTKKYSTDFFVEIFDAAFRSGHLNGFGDLGDFLRDRMQGLLKKDFDQLRFAQNLSEYLVNYDPVSFLSKTSQRSESHMYMRHLLDRLDSSNKEAAHVLRLAYIQFGMKWFKWVSYHLAKNANDLPDTEIFFNEILRLPVEEARQTLTDLTNWMDEQIAIGGLEKHRQEDVRIYYPAIKALEAMVHDKGRSSTSCNLLFLWPHTPVR